MADNQNRSWISRLPPGWTGLFTVLVDRLAALEPEPAVIDAKQKFGRLRVQLDHHDDTARALLQAAEEASLHTCEVCGGAGELVRHPSHYVQTLCLLHRGDARPPATPPLVSWREARRGRSGDDDA